MSIKFPIHPAHPERICWGCDQLCATHAMACANERSPHPSELFGDDWLEWSDRLAAPNPVPPPPTGASTPAQPQPSPSSTGCSLPTGH
ncbi:MAG: DUF3079 domain-containing protein [Rhodoferax sp.]|nr:DUF3079 domain-containing protein [Rhodoferax sp.]